MAPKGQTNDDLNTNVFISGKMTFLSASKIFPTTTIGLSNKPPSSGATIVTVPYHSLPFASLTTPGNEIFSAMLFSPLWPYYLLTFLN